MVEILEKKWTWRELRETDFPDDDPFYYELLNGILVKKSAPSPIHQSVSWRLAGLLQNFLVQNPDAGFGFTAPIDVFLEEGSAPQPDLCFIKKERSFIIDPTEGILGAPDIVVEIISPNSIFRDRVTKKALYERFAIKEYWIVDPNNQAIEIFMMQNNAYVLNQYLNPEGDLVAKSLVLEGFEVNIFELFGGLKF